MTTRIGVLTLARPTFDVPFAQEMADKALTRLQALGHDIVGDATLLFDADAAGAALERLRTERLDLVLILQVTFTDATMTVRIAETLDAPIAIWAFPEPRLGGRLRLNAYCGLNLAAHALGRAGVGFSWLYSAPDDAHLDDALADILAGGRRADAPNGAQAVEAGTDARAVAILGKLGQARIGVIGQHPAGFDTCRYEPDALEALAGVKVETCTLEDLFARAKAADADAVAQVREDVGAKLHGVDEVKPDELDRSLRVFKALEGLAAEKGFAAMGVRCWPEMFTEYGCAACGPMAMMNEKQVPCACEADVYGALTCLTLQETAGAPALLVDVVDMDSASETGVIWHCGLAPLSMADPEAQPEAAIHSNRRMPLLHQFPLKPGTVTLARFSQARNQTKLVLGTAEVVRAPMSFTGTSAVLRFDRPIDDIMQTVMAEGLEHHVAIVYGDHRDTLRAVAGRMGVPVLELA